MSNLSILPWFAARRAESAEGGCHGRRESAPPGAPSRHAASALAPAVNWRAAVAVTILCGWML